MTRGATTPPTPDYKSAEQLIHALVGAAGRGANLLLNVGPRPGRHHRPGIDASGCSSVGKWLATYGESVYGTRRGPIPPQPWGVSTAKGSKDRPTEIFLHVLKPEAETPIILNEATASLDAVPVREGHPVAVDAGGRRDGPGPAQGRPHAGRHDRRPAAAGHRPLPAADRHANSPESDRWM